MRVRGISRTLQVGMLGGAMLVFAAGAGLRSGSGVLEAQHNNGGQTKMPPEMQQDPTSPLEQPNTSPDPMRAKMDAERMKAQNDDRHKRLAADVDKLVTLTNELKTDVDKTTKDELSLDVIKKAQEIEKLAHDVQSRMKN